MNLTRRFWPTEQETLLLRAAVLDDDAPLAWKDLRESLQLERLSGEGTRLLPLVYRNLLAQGVDDPLVRSLSGHYRHTWLRNQLLLRRLSELVRSFGSAGIETMVLKGPALIVRYYQDSGVRPMADLDLLVRPDEAARAAAQLERMGWRCEGSLPAARALAELKSAPFVDSDGVQCDLHRNVAAPLLFADGRADPDADFWAGAVPIEIESASTLAMCAADQLLHVVVHGARLRSGATVRWAADAATVMRRAGHEIDWSRLAEQATARSCAPLVRDALRFLVGRLDLSVPAHVFATFDEARTSRAHELAYRAMERSSTLWTYAYMSRPWNPWQRVVRFPRFLRTRWAVAGRGPRWGRR